MPIERASTADRAFLAMEGGGRAEQIGVALVLESGPDGPDVATLTRLVGERLAAVPRLRQRLVPTPWGCGGPIWVDDARFDVRRHVRHVACPPPGDERAFLETVVSVVAEPVPAEAPLWSAAVVTGRTDGATSLVVVLHHVLADGVGGLAVLATLVDPGASAAAQPLPRERPTTRELALDAWRTHLRSLGRGRWWLRQVRRSFAAAGGLAPPRAESCSLLQPTGPRRAIGVVAVDGRALREAAHRFGATGNDAVLTAVAGALQRVLRGRGEAVDAVVIAVPVSGRRSDDDGSLGNMVSPMLVTVPTTGDARSRLLAVAGQVRRHRADASGPPPIALLGGLFRPLAALGGFRWYMRHQQRLHTLVSHVRGPEESVHVAGRRVRAAVPVALSESGNITAYFEVLSYAGTVTVTAIVDPDHVPDLDELLAGLRDELDVLAALEP
ncbi:wax ester/triacylglycerol synthase domain-containing protein [uncultured Nocardioides sp.]|uniref:wax ester/triacylglycerol synthase domain-containing protein n=1 Tax=uncultured Nocardioides sp. TaxID=198441 RepID=UPI002602107B|nr:wax ester/triacylglycerol synthase domain-containing protein [uncultured Nocardioides sp.]